MPVMPTRRHLLQAGALSIAAAPLSANRAADLLLPQAGWRHWQQPSFDLPAY
jgi:hypothetical protein